jgi:hypothetical protein
MDRQKLIKILIIIAIPTIYALLLRLWFGVTTWNGIFNLMKKNYLILLPSIVGALTVYFSKEEKVKNLSYRIFTPWIPIFAFFFITLFFATEGWPCLIIMILPIFLIAASVGGLIGGYFKL